MKETVFELGSVRLFGVREGSGPPVIMLHGITANAYVFTPMLAELGRDFFAVSVDQRGHGRSDAPVGDVYEAEHFAQDVLDLIDALDAGPAILVGHSLGCRNAMHAAVMAPEKVRFVLGVDYTPFIEPEVLDALETRVNSGSRVFATFNDVVAYLKDRYKILPEDAILIRAQYGYVQKDGGYHPLADPAAMAATAKGLKAPLEAVFEAARVPVHLVRGAESALVSAAAFAKTCAMRPDMGCTIIEGADHYVPEERPAPLVALVRESAGV